MQRVLHLCLAKHVGWVCHVTASLYNDAASNSSCHQAFLSSW